MHRRATEPERTCARPTCNGLASATLTYDYGAQTVWIDHLFVENHPMQHDLCLHHADITTPLRGWTLEDRRLGASVDMFPIARAS